jgi:very-short-patch-repair endonuclease
LLIDLAIQAMTGRRDPRLDIPLRTRAVQLARLTAEGFDRRQIVLLIPLDSGITRQTQDAIVTGAGWLAHNTHIPVWLIGPLLPDQHHIPLVRLKAPLPLTNAPIGKPHPASNVEKALEAALATERWAVGRRWNQSYQSDPLSSPVRLDLLWPDERCVVELDGPEHCHPVHFEADRQRDVQLQLDGYAVLRFTNARVIHDVGAVVHQIGTYIRGRRRDLMEGRKPWPAKN